MQLSIVKGYEGAISIGQKQRFGFYGSGPASYVQVTATGGGDPLLTPFGLYLDQVDACMDTTGVYVLLPVPTVVGSTRAAWRWAWFTASGMTQVAASTNLSTYNVQFGAGGGEF